jgi:hypothetical protein
MWCVSFVTVYITITVGYYQCISQVCGSMELYPQLVETFPCAVGVWWFTRNCCQLSYEVFIIGLNWLSKKEFSVICYVFFLSSVCT